MTDMQAAPMQGTAPLSTTIDVGHSSTAVGGGAPPAEKQAPPPPAKPETPADTMRAELARQREEEAKDAEKLRSEGEDAAKGAKAKMEEAEKAKDADKTKSDPKRKDEEFADKAKPSYSHETDGPGGKQSDAEKLAAGQEEQDEARQSEGQKRSDPPARFLPKAKEAWLTTPKSVRAEVYRMADEHEAEVTKYKAAGERYEPIRQFDEIAQKNGRELKDSLTKVVEIETALARNPVMGIEMILREVGPRKPDGQPLSLYEVAQHIARQTPEQFQQSMRGAMGQHQQEQVHQHTQTEVQQLRTELQNVRTETAAQTIIAPFAASHPRYQELEEDIALFLTSGKIPASLSPVEKLAAAYDMAERINPVGSRSASSLQDKTDVPADAIASPADEAGGKSIRGAPTGGSDPDDDGDDVTDIGKLLRREARKLA